MLRHFCLTLTAVAALVSPFHAAANEKNATVQDQSTEKKRPTIALVLAGGGAKGAAHIGVIKALEEMQIPVDIVTGTSMGSFVGGLYATGMSADEIESFIYSVEWNNGYRDRVSRTERRVRDKEYEDRYTLNPELGIGFGEFRSPRGLVQGQGMLRILRETTGNVARLDSFDELAIPYRSVASDIVELEPVVIGDGYLIDAMMASMSVPGALPPYEIDGRLLVDGGVTNNMPVDVAYEMGADVVIAVDISSDYKELDEFTSLFTVADQLSNYMVRRSTREQKEYLREGDIYMHPEVGDMQTTEFDRMPSAFEKGYQIAHENADKLAKLSVSSSEFQQYIDEKQQRRSALDFGHELTVDRIELGNNSHYSDEVIENRLNIEQGKALTFEELEESVDRLYVLDRFERVTYQYDKHEDENVLKVDVEEKRWGPNYLNFRFFLEDDFDTSSQYAIGASINFTDLNSHGAELKTNVEMGTDKLLEADFYTPLSPSLNWFSTSSLKYTDEQRHMPIDFETGEIPDPSLGAINDFVPITYKQFQAELAVGFHTELWRLLRFGGRYTQGKGEFTTIGSAGKVEFDRIGAFVNLRVDTLDSFSLPTKGYYLNIEYLYSLDNVDPSDAVDIVDKVSNDRVQEFSVEASAAHSFDRHTFVGRFDYGIVENSIGEFPVDPKELGGFLSLSGISRNSMIGNNLLFSSVVYRYRWFDNDFGMFKSPVYLGGSLEYGGVWNDTDIRFDDAPLYVAGSVFAGIDSPIGPIMFAYGRTEENNDSVYLILGTSF
ncbi:patatin-like phospholipase family protein [Vibrio astriarenae]|uniref:patatin-like phospholipase family protein n=1 Tax=Vibrio astriarenae TaxID=1481923 RepID=UPI0037365D79